MLVPCSYSSCPSHLLVLQAPLGPLHPEIFAVPSTWSAVLPDLPGAGFSSLMSLRTGPLLAGVLPDPFFTLCHTELLGRLTKRKPGKCVVFFCAPHWPLCVCVCVCVCVCGHLLPLKAGTLPVWFSAGASAPRGATLLSGPPCNFGESA